MRTVNWANWEMLGLCLSLGNTDYNFKKPSNSNSVFITMEYVVQSSAPCIIHFVFFLVTRPTGISIIKLPTRELNLTSFPTLSWYVSKDDDNTRLLTPLFDYQKWTEVLLHITNSYRKSSIYKRGKINYCENMKQLPDTMNHHFMFFPSLSIFPYAMFLNECIWLFLSLPSLKGK